MKRDYEAQREKILLPTFVESTKDSSVKKGILAEAPAYTVQAKRINRS